MSVFQKTTSPNARRKKSNRLDQARAGLDRRAGDGERSREEQPFAYAAHDGTLGLVRLEQGAGRKLEPVVTVDTVELTLTVAA